MDLIDNASIIEEFECPICYEYIAPPFIQCVEGHSICINCYHRVKLCPICRSELCTTTSNLVTQIHDIARFPCPYNNCEKWVLGRLRKRHLKICGHRKVACKLCGWSSKAMDLMEHFGEHHSELFGLEITKPISMFPFSVLMNQFLVECSISTTKWKVDVNLVHGSIENWFFKLHIISRDGQLVDILGTGNNSCPIEQFQNYVQNKGPLTMEVYIYNECSSNKNVFGKITL